MPNVHVVQENLKYDFSPARKFGELSVLCPPGDVSISAVALISRMRHKLVGFCDEDFLLLTGDPVMLGIACVCAAEENGGRFTILKWNRNQGEYFPVKVDMGKR